MWWFEYGAYWAALSLSFRQISIMLMNIIAWGPQVADNMEHATQAHSHIHKASA